MKHPHPNPDPNATPARLRPKDRSAHDRARPDADDDESEEACARTPSTEVQHLAFKANKAVVKNKQQQEKKVNSLNRDLDALAALDLRAITRHALRDGISARPGSGAPHQTAVGEGALLVAQVLRREGVAASDLRRLCGLWQQTITSSNLFVAAEQLLGPDFCHLTYARGTPLADLCEVLFASAHEVGDLVAAGAVVASIHRKLELIEGKLTLLLAPNPRKPFVRKYLAPASGGTPS